MPESDNPLRAGLVDWPHDCIERYRREGLWQTDTLGGLLEGWAHRFASNTAIVADERRLTYRELDIAASEIAGGIVRMGIRPFERVVIHLPNIPEFIVLCFALSRARAIPVFALPGHRVSEITHLCKASRAAAYISMGIWQRFDYREIGRSLQRNAPLLRNVIVIGDATEFTAYDSLSFPGIPLPTCHADDPALFQLSGGTTGLPKLIPRRHAEYAYSARASAELCELDTSSVYLAVLPIAHNFTFSSPGVFGTLHAGGKVVLAQTGDADTAFALIEKEKVTITAVVPPLAIAWLEAAPRHRRDCSSLRILQVGGSKLAEQVAVRVEPILGCRLQQVFGMAEGLVCYTRLNDPLKIRTATQGRPLSSSDEVRIVDDEDVEVAEGVVGHLLTRGPYTIRGYFEAQEYNRRAFTDDGFYRTGDLVRRTNTGHLVVEGRSKDLINRGGDKISAEEMEDHLLAHPCVGSVAAVAMPDRFLGEKLCIYIVPATALPPRLDDVRAFLRERGVAEYKLPERLEVIEALPLTNVGKINKARLRETIAAKLNGVCG